MFNSPVDKVIEIMETCRVISTGTRPSSMGSHTSVMLTELIAVSWCKGEILFFRISAMATVLLIACPIAFKTISFACFS